MKNLADMALEVHMSFPSYTGMTQDREAAREIEAEKGATRGAASVHKRLFAAEHVAGINRAREHIRHNVFYRYCSPWGENGVRLLNFMLIDQFQKDLMAGLASFDKEKEAFLERWPTIVAGVRDYLGDWADNTPLPTVDELRKRLRIVHSMRPVTPDWRVNMSEDIIEAMKADFQSEVADNTALATLDAYRRVREVVQPVMDSIERIENKKPGERRAMKESLFANVTMLTEILDALNINDDERLTAITDELRNTIGMVDAKSVRSDADLRKIVKESATTIMSEVEQGEDSLRNFLGL